MDISDDDLPADDELTDVDPKSRAYHSKLVEKMLSDASSQRSYSTTASTMAPSVVKDRINKTIDVKEQREQRKRCAAKGEASVITHVRNENRDSCKEYVCLMGFLRICYHFSADRKIHMRFA